MISVRGSASALGPLTRNGTGMSLGFLRTYPPKAHHDREWEHSFPVGNGTDGVHHPVDCALWGPRTGTREAQTCLIPILKRNQGVDTGSVWKFGAGPDSKLWRSTPCCCLQQPF